MDELFNSRREYLKEFHPTHDIIRCTVHDVTWLNDIIDDYPELIHNIDLYFQTYSKEMIIDILPEEQMEAFFKYITSLDTYLSDVLEFEYIDTPILDDTDLLFLPKKFGCIETFLMTEFNNTLVVTMEYAYAR